MAVLVVLEAVAIGLLALLVVGLLRSHAEILAALHRLGAGRESDADGAEAVMVPEPSVRGRGVGPGPGLAGAGVPGPGGEASWGPARDVAGVGPDGDPVAVGVAGSPHDSLLIFLSSGCTTCAGLWAALADRASLALLPDGVRPVVVTRGPDQESRAGVAARSSELVPVVMSSPAWDDYAIPGAPFFVHVDGPGARVVGQGVASRWDQVVALLLQAGADADLERASIGLGRRRAGAASNGAVRTDAEREARTSAEREARTDAEREARADQELRAAGIGPGHPSLYRTDLAPLPGADRPGAGAAQPAGPAGPAGGPPR